MASGRYYGDQLWIPCFPICWLEKKNLKKNFMTPFYGWGSTASRLELLRGGSLFFTTRFPEIPGTRHNGFEHGTLG